MKTYYMTKCYLIFKILYNLTIAFKKKIKFIIPYTKLTCQIY